MAKPHGIIGGVTAALLCASAFVASKNKAALQRDVNATSVADADVAKNTKRQDTAAKNLKDSKEKRVAAEAQVVSLEGEEKAQKQAAAEIESQVAAKKAEVDANKGKLDQLADKLKEMGDVQEVAGKLRSTLRENQEMTQKLASAEAKISSINSAISGSDRQITSMREESSWPARKVSNPNLRTRINAIYPQWGFVTIAAGNQSGVVDTSWLDVVRDGAVIAKLQVSSVEANSASATIVPDSMQEDVLLVPGDRVVAGAAPVAQTPPAVRP